MLIKVGTRKSKLAITQANLVIENLKSHHPEFQFEMHEIVTTGDKLYDQNLALIGGKGLFLKEIEDQMLLNHIDIAVHSMKDVPVHLPDGLVIDIMSPREISNDVFLSAKYNSIADLPENAVVGTSSARRRFQLLAMRPDLRVVNFRGNILTRLSKIDACEVDGAILAHAGIKRLGLEAHIKEQLSHQQFLPAVGQGVIAIERRVADRHIHQLLQSFHDAETYKCIQAERSYMLEMDGNCTTPIGAFCKVKGQNLNLTAQYFDVKTGLSYNANVTGLASKPILLGKAAAEHIKAQVK